MSWEIRWLFHSYISKQAAHNWRNAEHSWGSHWCSSYESNCNMGEETAAEHLTWHPSFDRNLVFPLEMEDSLHVCNPREHTGLLWAGRFKCKFGLESLTQFVICKVFRLGLRNFSASERCKENKTKRYSEKISRAQCFLFPFPCSVISGFPFILAVALFSWTISVHLQNTAWSA